MRKYRLLRDSTVEPALKAGVIVYDCILPNYGVKSDDERMFGYECRSITRDEKGSYPFVIVPARDLEPLTE
jgi:hypothetical protein